MKAFNEGQKRKKVCRSNDLVKAYQSQTTGALKKVDSNSYLVSYKKRALLCCLCLATDSIAVGGCPKEQCARSPPRGP